MKRGAISLALGLAACATPLVDSPPAPTTLPVVAAPPPAAKPAIPERFADPPLILDPNQPRDRPADLPGPGYHCHWVGPGKRYCHSGMD